MQKLYTNPGPVSTSFIKENKTKIRYHQYHHSGIINLLKSDYRISESISNIKLTLSDLAKIKQDNNLNLIYLLNLQLKSFSILPSILYDEPISS